MILTLRNILAAVLAGDFLLSFILATLFLILNRLRERKRGPETPPGRRITETREDLEAWRRLQNYSADDAYGTGGTG